MSHMNIFFFEDGHNVGYFDDSEVHWDTEDKSQYTMDGIEYLDDDKMREAIRIVEEQYSDTEYDLLGTKGDKHNCQDFASRVRMVYRQLGGRSRPVRSGP